MWRTTVFTILLAAALWVVIFAWRPLNFWMLMPVAVGILAAFALRLRGAAIAREGVRVDDVFLGLGSAVVLYGIFWVGGWTLRHLFAWVPEHLGGIYYLRELAPLPVIALLLLFVIGPGEELYWRGLVQSVLMERLGATGGWLAVTAVYAAVHLVALNPVLLVGALVASLFWGYLYLRVRRVATVAISHTAWDLAVLVFFPLA